MSASVNRRLSFASDNHAGITPEAWQALAEANASYDVAYGNDRWTAEVADKLRELFETDCEVFFVFNGTAANSLTLASMCRSYHSVICHRFSHIETSECGAPEFYSNGSKLLTLDGDNGKIGLDAFTTLVEQPENIHFPKPRVLSLTQTTEVGTLYTPQELAALSEAAHAHQMTVHMDGARFANAVAALDVSPADLAWRAGIDVLCFGGTKMGLPVGEAVVFFDKTLAHEFDYRCKQAGQLASKMRFISAPWLGMLADDIWLEHARHANTCAQRLAEALPGFDGVELVYPVQSNGVFVKLPPALAQGLREKGWLIYDFIGENCYRLMCSWATQSADIETFISDCK